MNEQELLKKCLKNKDASADKPFKDKQYRNLIVLRHKSNNKWFGLIFYNKENKLSINLKAEPEIISLIKEQFEAITSAWHMNKAHWCSVEVNGVPQETLDTLIQKSFDITNSKKKIAK